MTLLKTAKVTCKFIVGYRGHENRLFVCGPNWWQLTFPFSRGRPRLSLIWTNHS